MLKENGSPVLTLMRTANGNIATAQEEHPLRMALHKPWLFRIIPCELTQIG
ncbi:hypothetical protein EHW99_2497 [Erwinia amylovora]|uniref:Uncharacterized protein n=2 Tax=Erwinia amylovora TaxID=552 RepID=A0A831A2H7_ERWAM|nr:hypothetical protein EaACW_1091 [Erwinia amylovora ACW56400]QJQ55199.1 hypothetical protein EHX00_2497 [Erwinia amylovora]CBA20033.1 hypothetical protein predicted by Glimmer/Critica [Erwinia amylovora CFBP1430]CCO77936.1 hypothetical protein BN432_1116 [Erwinia amylovora Ea356]CCO81723.1 hypothetical protein BN433_1130 [Erwinia amylovora Ea266]CCO85527.1 hypothetical protein BN434_1117 [Erwinia amylovora CFBP 2585]CCO89311.1 hypothetical protein BN435_1117 [Erwinia amylovora 01SFR-BO]CCO